MHFYMLLTDINMVYPKFIKIGFFVFQFARSFLVSQSMRGVKKAGYFTLYWQLQ